MFKIVGPNISPLPFYESLAEQNHRKAYAFGRIYPLVTYRNMLMPFQVCLAGIIHIINKAIWYSTDTTYNNRPADSTFTLSQAPLIEKGAIWKKVSITYSDGNIVTTYQVSFIGLKKEIKTYNLLVNTLECLVPISGNPASNAYTYIALRLDSPMSIKAGDEFTISAEIEHIQGDATAFSIYPYSRPATSLAPIIQAKEGKNEYTFNLRSDYEATLDNFNILLYAGQAGSCVGNTVKYSNVMLVKGAEPKPYAPALSELPSDTIIREDIQYAITDNPIQPSNFIYKSREEAEAVGGRYLWIKKTSVFADKTEVKSYEVERQCYRIYLHEVSTSKKVEISKELTESGLEIKSYETFQVLRYPGLFPISAIKQEGQYYLELLFDSVEALSPLNTSTPPRLIKQSGSEQSGYYIAASGSIWSGVGTTFKVYSFPVVAGKKYRYLSDSYGLAGEYTGIGFSEAAFANGIATEPIYSVTQANTLQAVEGEYTPSADGYLYIAYKEGLGTPLELYEVTQEIVKEVSIYSEVFTSSNNIDNCILLEYGNSYNFELSGSIVDFSDNFKFRCYVCSQIGKPEYVFEEEVTERMGYSFMESQVSKKVYNFTFLAPEYLCDALRIVRLCDNKRIEGPNSKVYSLSTFEMNPEWEEQGDLASVECSFETDTVIANIGGYTPVLLGGDFNNDFNNDFNYE